MAYLASILAFLGDENPLVKRTIARGIAGVNSVVDCREILCYHTCCNWFPRRNNGYDNGRDNAIEGKFGFSSFSHLTAVDYTQILIGVYTFHNFLTSCDDYFSL